MPAVGVGGEAEDGIVVVEIHTYEEEDEGS